MRPVLSVGAGILSDMRTVLLGEPPKELQAWLDRRRELGQDGFDEVWDGEYHVAPMAHGRQGWTDEEIVTALRTRARAAGLRGSGPINVGQPDNYRVPDRAYLRTRRTALWNPTVTIAVEIISAGDESRLKFDFYFQADVEELLLVDPLARTVEWFARSAGGFVPSAGSALLSVTAAELAAEIEWPD